VTTVGVKVNYKFDTLYDKSQSKTTLKPNDVEYAKLLLQQQFINCAQSMNTKCMVAWQTKTVLAFTLIKGWH